eukprot:GGOE01041005.1.p1 GENE.GGOE01041005.1~~GGOE01041005.1.p1  ORF type:complete len:534 (-),score=150.83 GGOE01041005.1:335-1936(-)
MPPAVADPQPFLEFASQARGRLQAMWLTLGVEPAEQGATLADVEERARRVFLDAIAEVQCTCDAVEADVRAQAAAHAAACARLHTVVESEYVAYATDPCQEAGRPLLEQQRCLRQAVAKLLELLSLREEEMRRLHQRLFRLHSVVGIPLGRSRALRGCERFEDVGEDFTLQRQVQYQQEISQLIDAKRRADEEIIESVWLGVRELWAKLKISPHESARFQAEVSRIQPDTGDADLDEERREAIISLLRSQLAALQAEQERLLAELVRETSDMLRALWREYESRTGENMALELPTKGCESSVAVLEGLVLAMEDRLQQLEEVARVWEKRQTLLAEEVEMLRAQKDPERLLSKRSNMAQVLLREEKLRNTVKRELPRLEAKLRQCCAAWQERHGTPFMMEGRSVLGLLDGDAAPPVPAAPAPEERAAARSKSQGDSLVSAVRPLSVCNSNDRHFSPSARARSQDLTNAHALLMAPSPKCSGGSRLQAWSTDAGHARSPSSGAASPQCQNQAPLRAMEPPRSAAARARPRTSSLRR